MEIPAGIQPRTSLVMAKRGVPFMGKSNPRGDQLVRVVVQISNKLSKEERKLVQGIAEMLKPNFAVVG